MPIAAGGQRVYRGLSLSGLDSGEFILRYIREDDRIVVRVDGLDQPDVFDGRAEYEDRPTPA